MGNPKKKIKSIPYGIMNYLHLRKENYFYVDKTHFIPKIEEAGEYLFLIRPRRMGKSLWISLMECYYDVALKEEFQQVFRDTWVAENPTDEQGEYLVLRLNFSSVNPAPDKVEAHFNEFGNIALDQFLRKYAEAIGDDSILKIQSRTNFTLRLESLFQEIIPKNLKLYLFIDEYDNFSNTVLSTSGKKAYQKLTHGEGFFRHFFNVLKGGAMQTGGGQIKLFITGVSPITMDDVTSGFNIGDNITLEPAFNDMFGFTEEEVLTVLRYYAEHQQFPLDINHSMQLMKKWYNGYQFSKDADKCLFNTDMVLYFVNKSMRTGRIPEYLIDRNVRIDYGKLRHLITIDRKVNGNFEGLRSIIEKGQARARVVDSFPLEEVAEPDNFHSLLYYFGLLTFAGRGKRGKPILKVPNQTVYQLLFGYIRDALKDTECFRLNFQKLFELIEDMAYDGKWKALFTFLAEQIKSQTGIRDFLSEEKPIQSILAAYLNVTDYYVCYTEAELNKGYADILLEPLWAKHPEIRYGCLVEIKYINRSDYSEQRLQEKIIEAKKQIATYAEDQKLQEKIHNQYTLKIILIFNGWELVYMKAE